MVDIYDQDSGGLRAINAMMSPRGSDYPVIFNAETGMLAAHSAFPLAVGTVVDLQTVTDRPFEEFYADLQDNPGLWVEYPCDERGCINRNWIVAHDGHLISLPTHYSPQERTQKVVADTIDLYKSDPETAFERIAWQAVDVAVVYPFVLNATDFSTVAHGALPYFVGRCCSDDIRDTGDKSFEEILAEAREGSGSWVDYLFLNPINGLNEYKRTWLSLYDGYLFGAGFYSVGGLDAINALDEAIALYEADGVAALDKINAMMSTSPNYPFVLDAETFEILAHGADPDRWVGSNFKDKLAGFGTPGILEEALVSPDGVWTGFYPVLNPDVGIDQNKDSRLRVHDGYIFGAGYYFVANTAQ